MKELKLYVNWDEQEIITEKEKTERMEEDVDALYENDSEWKKWLNRNYDASEVFNTSFHDREMIEEDWKKSCQEMVEEAWEDETVWEEITFSLEEVNSELAEVLVLALVNN